MGEKPERPGRVAAIGLLLGLGMAAWVSLRLFSPAPEVRPNSTGEVAFSAERAWKHLEVIAAEPHSGGTEAHGRVRDYILRECRSSGLETTLLEQTGFRHGGRRLMAGRAQNILARLEGSAPGKAIMVVAHYDSVPNSPGAADDGAGVAAMLESMRLLKNSARLKNDVLFLFTDLEEFGLLGAEAFAHGHTNLADIALVMNFEARGSRGPVLTFEVSAGNGWLMRELRNAVGRVFATSIAYEIYRRMPNDTDFTVFREAGLAGFNNAFVDGFAHYHGADRIEALDPRSLQQLGEIMFRSLRHFGNRPLDQTRAEDAVYFNPAGDWLVIYPAKYDAGALAGLAGLCLGMLYLGWRKWRLHLAAILGGVLLWPAVLAASLGLAWGAMEGLAVLYPYYANFPGWHFYNSHWYLLMVAGICVTCLAAGYGWLARRRSLESVCYGGWLLLVILAFVLKNRAGTGAYLIYYPLMLAFVMQFVVFAIGLTVERHPIIVVLVQLCFLVPAWLFWIPIGYTLFIGFGMQFPAGAVVMIWLCLALALPGIAVIRSLGRFALAGVGILMTAAGFLGGHVTSEISADHPLRTSLGYGVVLDERKAYWISDVPALDPWVQRHIQNGEQRELPELFGQAPIRVWSDEAPFAPVAPAIVTVLEDLKQDGRRRIKMRVATDSDWEAIGLEFPAEARLLTVSGRALPASPNSPATVLFVAPPREGFEMEWEAGRSSKAKIKVTLRKHGVPAALLAAPLPKTSINAGHSLANTVVVSQSVEF